MKIKNKKLLTLIMIVVLVLSQCIVSSASDISYDKTKCPVPTTGKPYVYNVIMYSTNKSGELYTMEYITIESDVRMCLYQYDDEYTTDVPYKHAVKIIEEQGDYDTWCYYTEELAYANGITYYYDNGKVDDSSEFGGITSIGYINIDCVASSDGRIKYGLLYSDMPIFDDRELAQNYCQTGDLTGAIYEPSKSYNAEEIYLDNFYFEVHDSNDLSNFYVDLFYTPSEYLMNNIDNAMLYLELEFSLEWEIIAGALDIPFPFYNPYTYEIPLKSYPSSYRIYFDVDEYLNEDVSSFTRYLVKEAFLGDEFLIDTNDFDIADFGGSSIAEIEESSVSINLKPYIEGNFGMSYSGEVDFLNPQNSFYNSNTPDSNGNYVSDGNYTQQDGYYYTEVSQDNYGNNTYNYYYITDNSRTEIDSGSSGSGSSTGIQHHHHEHKWEGSVNVNVNGSFGGGSSSGDNVTIEDDDLTSDGLRSAIEDGYGLFDLVSTEKDNDGFLSLLTAFMGSLDDDMSNLIGFGMGTTVALALLLRLLNR